MLKAPPVWKTVFIPLGLIPHRTTFKFEYLRYFEPEFDIVLGYESGAIWGRFMKKNQRPKISCYCTFQMEKASLNKITSVNMAEIL